ncbi:MAG: MotA/TolQ/ExbB proton channel family protein [Armatimonadota bacterium]
MMDFLSTRALVEKFEEGGPMMWPLLICSVLALMVIIYKVIAFALAQGNTDRFLADVEKFLARGETDQARALCLSLRGPVAQVTLAAIDSGSFDRATILEAAEEAGVRQVSWLEGWLPLLSTVAGIAPLMGFLGTVTGMIRAFEGIRTAEVLRPDAVAGGIGEALITTATGLIIAIPCLAAYNYFVSRVKGFTLEMERASNHVAQVMVQETPHEA